MSALGMRFCFWALFGVWVALLAFALCVAPVHADGERREYVRVTYQLVAALGFEDRPYMTGALFGFNDSPETTHADVLAALDKAIALAEAAS